MTKAGLSVTRVDNWAMDRSKRTGGGDLYRKVDDVSSGRWSDDVYAGCNARVEGRFSGGKYPIEAVEQRLGQLLCFSNSIKMIHGDKRGLDTRLYCRLCFFNILLRVVSALNTCDDRLLLSISDEYLKHSQIAEHGNSHTFN